MIPGWSLAMTVRTIEVFMGLVFQLLGGMETSYRKYRCGGTVMECWEKNKIYLAANYANSYEWAGAKFTARFL